MCLCCLVLCMLVLGCKVWLWCLLIVVMGFLVSVGVDYRVSDRSRGIMCMGGVFLVCLGVVRFLCCCGWCGC